MKQSYNSGVKCGNWFEDMKGAELAKTSMQHNPPWEISETKSQYYSRFGQRDPSVPAMQGTDAIPGRLVFAHGPNIIDERLPPDHYLTNTDAVYSKGLKPQDIANTTLVQTGALNRTELIARKARMRAAGVDAWDPPVTSKASVPSVPRTVMWTGVPTIPVEGLGARVSMQYTSMNTQVAADSSTASSVAPPSGPSFGREGGFSKSFRSLHGEGCVTSRDVAAKGH